MYKEPGCLRHEVPPKRHLISARLQGATSQEAAIFILIADRRSRRYNAHSFNSRPGLGRLSVRPSGCFNLESARRTTRQSEVRVAEARRTWARVACIVTKTKRGPCVRCLAAPSPTTGARSSFHAVWTAPLSCESRSRQQRSACPPVEEYTASRQ